MEELVLSQEAGVLGEGGGFSATNNRSASLGEGPRGSGTGPRDGSWTKIRILGHDRDACWD